MNLASLIQNSELVVQSIETERINNAQLGEKAQAKIDTMIAQTEAVVSLVQELVRQLGTMKSAFAAEIMERDKALANIIAADEANDAK